MWFVTVTISLAALLALAGLFQFVGLRRDTRAFPPPGRLIDIGGRRLHARVDGSGAPPVIFEAGISASSVNWIIAQPPVAAFTTTCCYDRAGLGGSDPPRETYDVESMLQDLTALLDRLGLPEPCVLVGHSYGGLLVRLFAERCPGRVAGLVLIDPILACCWQHRDAAHARVKQKAERIARWGAWFARLGLARFATSPALVMRVILPRLGTKGGVPATGVVGRLQTELVKLPRATVPVIRAHWCRPQNYRAMSAHLATLDASFDALRNLPLNCPITVISAADTPPDGMAEHRAVAALSVRGRHIVAHSSGHWIQFDEPDLVIDAIRQMVQG